MTNNDHTDKQRAATCFAEGKIAARGSMLGGTLSMTEIRLPPFEHLEMTAADAISAAYRAEGLADRLLGCEPTGASSGASEEPGSLLGRLSAADDQVASAVRRINYALGRIENAIS